MDKVKKTKGNPADRFGGAGPGRPKGVPNKQTTQVREMILQALDMAGGADYLAAQAVSSPGAFLSLVGKVLPLQITGEGGGAVKVVTKVELVALCKK